MNLFRRLPLSRLLALIAAALVVLGAGAAIAVAALNGDGPTPPPKPLAQALKQGLSAGEVPGSSAGARKAAAIGTGSALRTAVICSYLSNEGVSILENAGHLGLPVPDKLKTVLEQLHDRKEAE